MSEYILSCCSTSDLSVDYFTKHPKLQYIPFHFMLDGQEYEDDLGQTVSYDVFYKKIEEGCMPTTSQVNAEAYYAFWEPFLKEGKDILHVSLSTGLSGSFNSACIARDDLLEKYPDRAIYVVDSLGASSGYGLIMDTLYDKMEAGASLEELYKWVEENKLNLHHWFFSGDLTHYKRGGRISAASATFGNLLNICPLMNMNYKGELIPRTKIRPKKKVISEIVHMMEIHAQNGLEYSGKCFISMSACMDDARAVADLVETKFPKLNGKVMINSVGTVIGAHTGPGTVALFFWGDKRED